MAIDPERFGDAIKGLIDRKFELLTAKLDARLARLEAAAGVASPPIAADKTVASAAMFSAERAYQHDDIAMTSDGQLWRALRYTKGARHPRNNPASWTRAL